MREPTDRENSLELDPLFVNSLREARLILTLWAVCCIYTVSYCYLFGYLSHEPDPSSTGPGISELVGPLTEFNRDPSTLTYPFNLGIPDWVFYGVVLPWVFCMVFTVWYVFFFFADDELAPDDAVDENGVTETPA